MSEPGELNVECAPGSIVKSANNFLNVAKRLHQRNASFCFWNVSKEFKILVRNVEEQESQIDLELIVVDDDDESDVEDEGISRVLDLEYEGYYDDDNHDYFVVSTVSMPLDAAPDDPPVTESMKIVNDLFATRICFCEQYFLRPGDSMCYACELRAEDKDLELCLCPICHEEGPRLHMHVQSCCKQPVHKKCLEVWKRHKKRKREDVLCPMCRAEIL